MELTKEQLIQNGEAMIAFANGKQIEFFADDEDKWKPTLNVTHMDSTLHRIKPEPIKRPWSKPDDVPGPVCWIRYMEAEGYCTIIVGIRPEGIASACNAPDPNPIRLILFADIGDYEYSTDRKTWLPCTVEVSE